MAKSAFLSVASTHNVMRRTGTFYGLTLTPAAGSTVIVADLANQGATGPNFNAPTGVTGVFEVLGPWPADGVPRTYRAFGKQVSAGLTVAYTSTTYITVHYD